MKQNEMECPNSAWNMTMCQLLLLYNTFTHTHIHTYIHANFMCAKIFHKDDHDMYKHSKFYVAMRHKHVIYLPALDIYTVIIVFVIIVCVQERNEIKSPRKKVPEAHHRTQLLNHKLCMVKLVLDA